MHGLSEVPGCLPLLAEPHEIRCRAEEVTEVRSLSRHPGTGAHKKGDLACVEACPVHALVSTTEAPLGVAGYEIDLRGEGWARLGLPTRRKP